MALLASDVAPKITDGTNTLELQPLDNWEDSYSINSSRIKIPFQTGESFVLGTENGRTIKVSGHLETFDLEEIEDWINTFETIVNTQTGFDLYRNDGASGSDQRYYTDVYMLGELSTSYRAISRHSAFEWMTWSCTFIATNPDLQTPGGGGGASNLTVPAGSNLIVHGHIYQYNSSSDLVRVMPNNGPIRTKFGIEATQGSITFP